MRLTPELGVSIGGFYRRDDGLRDPGYTADRGGQFRAGLHYDDGTTRLSFNVKHLNDRVILYLPVPLQFDDQGNVGAIPGFDPLFDTLAGPDNVHVTFKTPSGPQTFDLSEGTHSRMDFYTLSGRRALGANAALGVKARLRTGITSRNGLFPVGRPQSGIDYAAGVWPQLAAAFPTAVGTEIRYADSGAPLLPDSNGNGLVVGANLLSVRLPMREFIGDVRLTGQMQQWGSHDLAVGLTYADSALEYDRMMGTVLLDLHGQARRLDVVAVDARGQRVGSLTDNGFVKYGSLYDGVTLKTANLALYAADEWKLGEHWRIDLGGRWEQTHIGGRVEGSSAVDLGDPATLADDAVLTGTGLFSPVDRHFSGFSWTAGVNFHPDRGTGLFLRFTRIARLPSATEFYAEPDRTDEAIVPITMTEAGLILQRRHWNLSAVAFSTHFSRLPFTDHRFDPATSTYVDQTSIADTEAVGLEMSAYAKLPGPFSIDVQATLQDSRYRNFRYNEVSDGVPVTHDVTGNRLIRVPRIALRASPSVDLWSGRLRICADLIHYSARYADIANSQRLPPFSMINARITARINDHVTLTANGTNLTNNLGLTEGNPRMGSFDAGGMTSRYFLARPEFGRTVRATLHFSY
jgi:outer membrane receptor protein involved in Fe transport